MLSTTMMMCWEREAVASWTMQYRMGHLACAIAILMFVITIYLTLSYKSVEQCVIRPSLLYHPSAINLIVALLDACSRLLHVELQSMSRACPHPCAATSCYFRRTSGDNGVLCCVGLGGSMCDNAKRRGVGDVFPCSVGGVSSCQLQGTSTSSEVYHGEHFHWTMRSVFEYAFKS